MGNKNTRSACSAMSIKVIWCFYCKQVLLAAEVRQRRFEVVKKLFHTPLTMEPEKGIPKQTL